MKTKVVVVNSLTYVKQPKMSAFAYSVVFIYLYPASNNLNKLLSTLTE